MHALHGLRAACLHACLDPPAGAWSQMERRERLRKLLAEREAAGDAALEGASLIGQVRGHAMPLLCLESCQQSQRRPLLQLQDSFQTHKGTGCLSQQCRRHSPRV